MVALDLDQPIHDQIDESRTVSRSRVPTDVRAYYDGDQPPVATLEQQAALGDRANRPYIENQLKRCTDVLASRILFRKYVCEDDPGIMDTLATFSGKNQLSEQTVTNTVRVLVDGNNAISLSWNGKRVMMHQERWWDGKAGMYVEIGESGVADWAVKEWTDRRDRRRRTVYLPDRVLRFIDASGWVAYPDDAQGIVPWVRAGGDPLGVPVVHFGNTVTTDSLYGTSTLESLLGLQDALNGTVFDIVGAQALNAFPVYTATGVDTKSEDYWVGPGAVWKSETGQFGVLANGSMTAILDGYRTLRSSIAGQFPVAEHLIAGGTFPSGLALIKAESPMVGHAKLLGETFAPSFVLLAHRAIELMNVFERAGLDENALIRVEYAPAEQLDEGTVVEIDRERVGLYRDLADLPKSLMLKTGLVDDAEADAILADRDARLRVEAY